VPTCRSILALDIHHLVQVSEGGGDSERNLIALCPTCHALFHRGTIARDSLYAWKSMLISLSRAFDHSTLDDLLFLASPSVEALRVSGDGVLRFARLIGSGLACFEGNRRVGVSDHYKVALSEKGAHLVAAWQSGNREQVAALLGEA